MIAAAEDRARLEISFGKSQRSHRVLRVILESISDLARYLREHPSTKSGGAYITPAPMRGNRRAKANAESASLIGLDFDELTPDDATAIKKASSEFAGVLYETRSSTPAAPRIRLIVLTARPVVPARYREAHDALATELALLARTTFRIDPSCNKPEQPLFTPPADRIVIELKGDPFEPPPEADVGEPESRGNGVDLDPLIDETQRNVSLASIAGGLRSRGASVAQILAALLGINATLPEPLPEREVRTIAKSYGRYDRGETLPTIRIVSKANSAEKPKALPGMPDGLTTEIVAWAADRAQNICPQLDVAVGLLCTALLSANRYVVESWHTPLQPYIMALAPTGGGKTETRKSVTTMMKTAARVGTIDLTEHVFVGFQSYHAFFDKLAEPPSVVAWLWDEAARRLKSANRNVGSPDYQVLSHILDLYGAANSTMAAMPGRGQNIPAIDRPFLNVLAMAQPSLMTDAVTQTDFDTGMIARFLLLDAGDGVMPRNDRRRDRMGPRLMSRLRAFSGRELQDEFTRVRLGTGMHKRLLEYDDFRRGRMAEGPIAATLWTRAHQNALIVAGLIAVGRDPLTPVIDSPVVEYAITLSNRSTEDWTKRLRSSAAGSTWHEKLTKKVEELIRSPGKMLQRTDGRERELVKAGVMPVAVLKRAIRYDKRRDVEDILTALREAQIVIKGNFQGVTCYRWVSRVREE